MLDPKFCTLLAALIILLYDYIITFEDEIELVWSKRFSFGTALFVITRYLPFIDMPILLALRKMTNLTIHQCDSTFAATTTFQMIGIAVAELILVLRTIAIWRRNLYIAATLISLFTLSFAFCLYFTVVYTTTSVYTSERDSPCVLISVNKIVFVDFIIIIFMESVVVVLTIIKAVQHAGQTTSSWVFQLYSRGIFYFVLILGVSILNLLLVLLSPPPSKLLFVALQRVFHSVFCNRIIFLLYNQKGMTTPPISSFQGGETGWQFTANLPTLQTVLDLDSFTTLAENYERTIETSSTNSYHV
ncbi:hypothetical protein CPB83DRAFT_863575 [Crepidotus variabilis]|uniref:DUF6533 domain-containing protein n=1 Tax=Crepidotus variabilis TaxID=179855 RepID=A0A9P6E5Q5_9AGAR|nr:hypothetical protein CPB83DRAFT_863575 [Crepidotus variabilis]